MAKEKEMKQVEAKEESPKLKERVAQVEKALRKRDFETALAVLEPWSLEIYKEEKTKEIVDKLRADFGTIATELEGENKEEGEKHLKEQLHGMYTYLDTLHAGSRIQEEVSYPMVNPNHKDMLEMYSYFSGCPIHDEEELAWFHKAARKSKDRMLDMVIRAMENSVMECFWEPTLKALIEEIDSPNELVARRCACAAVSAMIYHDGRLEVYPELREAFEKAVEKHGDEMMDAFVEECHNTHVRYFRIDEPEEVDLKKLPKALLKMMEEAGVDPESLWAERPRDEKGYRLMHKVLDRLSGSWVMSVLLPMPDEEEELPEGKVDPESREGKLCYMFMYIGRPEFLLAEPENAERWLTYNIEEEHSENPLDFLHFGHLYLRKGDKEKAMEYYCKALGMYEDKEIFYETLSFEKRFLKEYGYGEESVFDALAEELRKG